MTERPEIKGADERELEAITREIHAQLRASYGLPPEVEPSDPPSPQIRRQAAPGDLARFLAAFLLPPMAIVGLALLLRMSQGGF